MNDDMLLMSLQRPCEYHAASYTEYDDNKHFYVNEKPHSILLLTYSKINFIIYMENVYVPVVRLYFNLYLIDTVVAKIKSFCQQADLRFDNVVIGLLKADWLTWSALTTDWLRYMCKGCACMRSRAIGNFPLPTSGVVKNNNLIVGLLVITSSSHSN